MYKIAICGQANTGKNTVSKILRKELYKSKKGVFCEYIAFADPIKAMIRLMFPDLPEKFLTGSSKYRSEIIPGAMKDDKPLTVRQLLIDLGTGVGRSYKETIWLDAFDKSFERAIGKKKDIIIVTDVRFINEFYHLKQKDFFQIKLYRPTVTSNLIKHASETQQTTIPDSEFDYVLYNDKSLKELKLEIVNEILPKLKGK